MSNSGVVQYDNIFHNLEQNAGRLRFTKGGLGWKPTADSSGAAGSSSQTHTLEAERFRSFQWYKAARGYQLRINIDSESETEPPRDCFDGFKKEDYERVADMVRDLYDATLEAVETSTRGWNWGKAEIEDSDVRFYVKDKLAFEVPVAHIANSNIAGKTEVSMEFVHPESQQPATNTGATSGSGNKSGKKIRGDQLVEMRLHVPGTVDKSGGDDDDAEADGEDGGEEDTAANVFHDRIKRKADIGQAAGDSIIVFKEVLVLTPRGRYDIDMFPTFLRLRGKTYDYKVLYQSINRLFLLPKADEVHVQFVIGLDPPIRQGQTRYPYLVLQFPREEEMDAELNLDDETIQSKYEGKLKRRYEEPTFKVVTNLFKVLSGQKLTVPGSFSSSGEHASVKCNVKATEGLLYPLDKAMLWVSKQPIHVPYSDVHQVIFSRVGLGGSTAGVTSSKTFDLRVNTRSGTEHTFASINREEHDRLNAHFIERKLRVKNEMNESELGLAQALNDESSSDEAEDSDTGKKSRKSAAGGKAAAAAAGEDDDEDSEEDEDFQASSDDDGGSPSEASDEESDATMADGDDDDDERPAKKKKSSK
ncbi:SSrecog-domain-containing protein [Jaminaea rosea]|uniref:FACT complex subunit POB3 n=1 Tax=Jaminaea rosea TaxID=1569628 RepID=A0A316UVD1_9BASI|nr:SSrecog-domain-containing protein [Jaminaea rosea]PWN29182.1 SSrecog-domain-containing protein [Jaminaea rosea]